MRNYRLLVIQSEYFQAQGGSIGMPLLRYELHTKAPIMQSCEAWNREMRSLLTRNQTMDCGAHLS